MTINSVNNLSHTQQTKDVISNSDKKKIDNKETTKDKVIVDKFDKSEVKPEATYKKPVYQKDEHTISQIKAEVDKIHSNLKSLVEKLLKRQGMTFKDLDANGKDIEIDEETRIEAQKAIDEGGELSIESVSDRLVDFAKAISGGDKSKISLMRDSIKEGFEEAEKVWGGKLPEISYKTLDRALEKLDLWESE